MQSKEKSKKQYKKKNKTNYKTLKFRLFPEENEIEKLNLLLEQFRWYYNSMVTIFYTHFGPEKILNRNEYYFSELRDLMKKYEYREDHYDDDNMIIKGYFYDEKRNKIPVPEWWENNVYSRLPRGAVAKFTSSVNSAISNYKNGNINKFDMKFRKKKNDIDYLHFEDSSYPAFINKIKSRYWYTTKDRKRKCISLRDLDCKKRSIEIIYEKAKNRYFLHIPVEREWFFSDDKRNDKQVKFVSEKDRIIALDPGIRKFLVGYDPRGESIFIGDRASTELTNLLYKLDKTTNDKSKKLLRRKLKNLISELHWKVASFLVKNYDIILIPDFRVSQMITKKSLPKIVKRLMCMFSFFKFKEKLKFKCEEYGKKLIIVDESYTSRTCGNCGKLRNKNSKEVFYCSKCKLLGDRDVLAARNILIKNIMLR